MSIRRLFMLGTFLLMGLSAWAQAAYPKVEAYADFSLVRFNPTKRFTNSHTIYGGGGGFTYYFSKVLGVTADFQGYGSQNSSFTIPAGGISLVPLVPATPTRFNANGNLFTYLFGPQFKVHKHKLEPFGQVLFGGAHSNVYANLSKQPGLAGIGTAPSQNAFSLLAGGGVDVVVAKHIAIRPVEVGYLLTRFSNRFTGNQNQNNFRYSAGIVFRSSSQ
jgi:hypothetical protein